MDVAKEERENYTEGGTIFDGTITPHVWHDTMGDYKLKIDQEYPRTILFPDGATGVR